MRVNLSDEFIIGGYSVGGSTFDAVILGQVVDGKLFYVARTRSGFTPASRAELLRKMKPLEVAATPFVNLPESRPGRWGEGLTADKMNDCRWLRPSLVGRIEFLEWTADQICASYCTSSWTDTQLSRYGPWPIARFGHLGSSQLRLRL